MTAQGSWPAPPESGAGRAQRQTRRSGVRRAEILQAAMAVFGENGYANGSLADIAARVGMTHAGVLHHFGSKEQLLVAVLEYRDDADVAELEGQHAPRGSAFLDHLVSTAQLNQRRRGIVQAYTVLLGESVTESHPARAFFTGRYQGLRRMVASALADATARKPSDPKVKAGAQAIVAAMDGLQSQWLLDPDAVDMAAGVRLVVDSVVTALRK
ncbi:MAG: TetR/AcrR family transcriptional regulator [Motilibacteraceae bacterium]